MVYQTHVLRLFGHTKCLLVEWVCVLAHVGVEGRSRGNEMRGFRRECGGGGGGVEEKGQAETAEAETSSEVSCWTSSSPDCVDYDD